MEYKETIFIDLETFSSEDLKSSNVYKYCESIDFEIILISWCFLKGEVHVEEEISDYLRDLLLDPAVLKVAHNVQFELACLATVMPIDPRQWQDTIVACRVLGLPNSLENACQELDLKVKKVEGSHLMKIFSIPHPTGGRYFPRQFPAKWKEYKDYCAADTATCRELYLKLKKLKVYPPQEIWDQWHLDQEINARGFPVDAAFVHQAVQCGEKIKDRYGKDLIKLTGVTPPASVPQFRAWLTVQLGKDPLGVGAPVLDAILEENPPEIVQKAIFYRKQVTQTSISKYQSILDHMQTDNRCRGSLQFYGAITGRWSGMGIQPQNFKRAADVELREKVFRGDLWDMDSLSGLMRTSIASSAEYICFSDFSAIECRLLAWVAGEEWVLDVFKSNGDIYVATAANMYGIPAENITKDSPERFKGKIATLSLGYQGGVNALYNAGKGKITKEDAAKIVKKYQSSNPHIKDLWKHVEQYAFDSIANKKVNTLKLPYCKITFGADELFFVILLPSGRQLFYYKPYIKNGSMYYTTILPTGYIQEKKFYGGLLVENIIQACARDVLVDAMLKMRTAQVKIILTVHDEVVAEGTQDTLKTMLACMENPSPWAEGCPIKGEGGMDKFYSK